MTIDKSKLNIIDFIDQSIKIDTHNRSCINFIYFIDVEDGYFFPS